MSCGSLFKESLSVKGVYLQSWNMMAGICLEMMGTKEWQECRWNKIGQVLIIAEGCKVES